MSPSQPQLQTDIEARLAAAEPEVEVLLVEQARGRVRLVVDHPEGVDLGLCERVAMRLRDLLEDGVEVSSPGPQRPLTKPEHFRRFLGRRARVRTRLPVAGQRTFTGELVAASDGDVTLAAGEGLVSISFAEIKRSNLLEG